MNGATLTRGREAEGAHEAVEAGALSGEVQRSSAAASPLPARPLLAQAELIQPRRRIRARGRQPVLRVRVCDSLC